MIHKDFKTANVLVDENFIAKVADAGVRNFLGREDVGTSSHVSADQIFLSPEYLKLFTFEAHICLFVFLHPKSLKKFPLFARVQEFRRFSEKSDVYAFGVFLLELVSGREAAEPSPSSSTQTLVEWVCNHTQNRF